MAVDGEAGRRVVGDHRVPVVERRAARAPRAARARARAGCPPPPPRGRARRRPGATAPAGDRRPGRRRRPTTPAGPAPGARPPRAPRGRRASGRGRRPRGLRRARRPRRRARRGRSRGRGGRPRERERRPCARAGAWVVRVGRARAAEGLTPRRAKRRGDAAAGADAAGSADGADGGGADDGGLARRARAEGQDLRRDVDDGAADRAGVDVGGQDLDAAALGLVDEGVGRVEAHRLLVEQRAQELGPVVDAQPGRLVGQQAEGGAVGLGEAEAREADDHRPHALGQRLVDVGPLAPSRPRRSRGGGPRSPRPSACGSSPGAAPRPPPARSPRRPSRPR